MVGVGDKLPQATLWTLSDGRSRKVTTEEVLGHGRVVLFAVPGAFTPGCSTEHLPGYVENAGRLSDKGVDRIACVAVNDPWVMDAWGRSQGVGESITMLSDGDGELTRAMGMELDLAKLGLGPLRSQRYAAVIHDGTILHLDVDHRGAVDVSSCQAVLERL